MRTLATDATADQLLDYLASDGAGGEWTYYADLAEFLPAGDWRKSGGRRWGCNCG
jgi:hypothetical protein